MMLNALADYYRRKMEMGDNNLPPPGYEWREIPFVVEIDETGRFLDVYDMRNGDGAKKRGKNYLLPQGPVGRTSGVKPYLLADNPEYLFLDDEKRAAFIALIQQMPDSLLEPDLAALLTFLVSGDFEKVFSHPHWEEILSTKAMLAFRLRGEIDLIGQSRFIQEYMATHPNLEADSEGICLITGERGWVARLHPLIQGVKNAKTTGAALVSFQKDSGYDSYGKQQGNNAPVSKRAAFAYTTVLNHLLARDSGQRLQVGDASTVFWAEKPGHLLETLAVDIFGEPLKDDPDRNVRAVESLFKSPQTGVFATDGDTTRFYVLGLAPNAARIAVRFWHTGTVDELARRFRRYFDDLEIVRPGFEKPYLSLFRLLVSVASLGKAENIPPNLAGDVMRAILAGTPYPATLFQGALRRIRAECGDVSRPRAALLKACLNRMNFTNEKEITVSLDETNLNPGYRLGRLFAVLEKIQEEAQPGINATIRDRYYGAASSTPVTVFGTLVKLSKHHLAKLENRGRAVNLEKLVGAIVDGLNDFPAHLPLADQGRFAIGYYHQRQAFFTTKPETEKGE